MIQNPRLALKTIQGLVVIRHGELVYEKYWANAWARAEPSWKNVTFSAGKSWGATMVGRATTQGKLMVYLVAFQNGFFWKSFFEQQKRTVKHATQRAA